MNFFKRILFSLLGVKTYLLVVSKFFFYAYKLRLLTHDNNYDCHYFVKNLINEGDVVKKFKPILQIDQVESPKNLIYSLLLNVNSI